MVTSGDDKENILICSRGSARDEQFSNSSHNTLRNNLKTRNAVWGVEAAKGLRIDRKRNWRGHALFDSGTPWTKHLDIGGVVQRFVPSVVDRVQSASVSVPSTSRMQRAPIINELHCDLLSCGGGG